MKNDLTVS